MLQFTKMNKLQFIRIIRAPAASASYKQSRCYSSETTEWERAKPLEQMPGFTKWQLFRAFMPGGKFHNIEFNRMLRTVKEDVGDIAFMPALLGQPNRIITYKPDDFEMVLRTEGVYPNRQGFATVRYHREVHRKEYFQDTIGTLAANDEKWGSFRSAVNPVLMQPKTVKTYLNRMSSVSDEFVQRIKNIRDPSTLEVPANFDWEINRWTLESVAVVALDKHLGLISDKPNADATEFFRHLNKFFELFTDLEIRPPLWKIVKTKQFKEMMVALDGITDFVDKYIKEAMERLQADSAAVDRPEAEKSVLEKLLKIDQKIASVMAMDMLFAGVDTTTTTFTGIMLCLAKFPEKQQKLREEIFQILPDKNSPLTEANMKNMPYMRACLKESLRMYPLGPGVVRFTTKDIVLSGYRVPKGTDISLINFMLLSDPKYYPQPEQFVPERWQRQDNKFAEEQCPVKNNNSTEEQYPGKSNHPFVHFPFGFGPRSCVGKRIVEMELEIGIARLLRNFQVEFNYPTENIFKNILINVPAKPLKFKFTDL